MNSQRSAAGSTYMQWAKLRSTAKFNLATSGMAGFPLADLGVTLGELDINGPSIYGYEPLLQAMSQRYRVPVESVVTAVGTSLANYLALAAATEPGDEVLIEQPTYDPLLAIANYLGLAVKRFQRRPERNFAIDLDDLARNLSSRTRVIALCNMHNPSGALTSEDEMRQIAALARRHGSYVLVDEVYKEMFFEERPETAFHIDPERFLITSSLTKAYGLSGLRCGWIFAPKSLAERIWRLHDIHCGTYAYPAEALSVVAFQKLPMIAARMKAMLDSNRALVKQFLDSRNDLEFFWPEFGTIVFPRLKTGNVDAFCDFLRNEFETSVVPGRFFECSDRMRIGVGVTTESVRDALIQLERGLESYKDAKKEALA